MLKSGAAVVAGMMLVIGLAGCGASVQADGVGQSSSTPSATASTEPTAAPIEMEASPEIDPATPWGEAGFESADAWYIANMASVWQGDMPADAQLLGAGALACQQAAEGAAPDTITVVNGDNPDAVLNNRNAVNYALSTLCPS